MSLTDDEIRAAVELDRSLPRTPWFQFSGKYMAIDHGDSPQVFHAFWDGDKLCEMRNRFHDLCEDVLRLRAENERLRNLRCACCGEKPLLLPNIEDDGA